MHCFTKRYAVNLEGLIRQPPKQQVRSICDAKDGMAYNTWAKKMAQVVENREDVVRPEPLVAFEGTFGTQKTTSNSSLSAPPLSHYMYCLPFNKPTSELADDGYHNTIILKNDVFQPPVPFSLRMWGGAQTRFLNPMTLGMHIKQKMFLRKSYLKQGRSGPFVIAVVGLEVEGEENSSSSSPSGVWKPLISEDLNFIYRHEKESAIPIDKPKIVPETPLHSKQISLDSIQLFRYSALTFNSHKIHYDRKYAAEKEKYGGLLVHGPLQAALLADYVSSFIPHHLSNFEYRAVSPLVLSGDTVSLTLCAKPVQKDNNGIENWNVWIIGPDNTITMTGTAQ